MSGVTPSSSQFVPEIGLIARPVGIVAYDNVRVTTADGLDQTLRPTTITHTLSPGVRSDKWTVDVAFAADAAAAAPIPVPPPPGLSLTAGATAVPYAKYVLGVSLNTNAQGDATWTFPEAFPTELLGFTATDALPPATAGAVLIKAYNQFSDRTRISVRAYGSNGAALANFGIALNVVAFGR